MSFGFRAINTSGIVQIDGQFRNHEVFQEGVVTGETQYIYFDADDDLSNLVFVRPKANGILVANYGLYPGAGLAGEEYFRTITKPNGMPPSTTRHVDYVITRKTPLLATQDTFGLRVLDEQSSVAFDSRRRYLKIAHVMYAQMGPGYPSPQIIHTVDLPPPPPGKRYYILLNSLVRTDSEGDRNGTYTYGYGAWFESDTRVKVNPREELEYSYLAGTRRLMPPENTRCIVIAEI